MIPDNYHEIELFDPAQLEGPGYPKYISFIGLELTGSYQEVPWDQLDSAVKRVLSPEECRIFLTASDTSALNAAALHTLRWQSWPNYL